VDLRGLKRAFDLLKNAELELKVGVDEQQVDQTYSTDRDTSSVRGRKLQRMHLSNYGEAGLRHSRSMDLKKL
jgi:hypothetical protein